MYVILTQDVPKLGSQNALVNVTRGYFVNFLEPKGFAKQATPKMIDRLKEAIIAERQASQKKVQTQETAANALQDVTVSLRSKASEKGTLFQALTEADVVAALKAEHGVDLDPSSLDMKALKKVGEHTVTVILGDQKINMKVNVAPTDES